MFRFLSPIFESWDCQHPHSSSGPAMASYVASIICKHGVQDMEVKLSEVVRHCSTEGLGSRHQPETGADVQSPNTCDSCQVGLLARDINFWPRLSKSPMLLLSLWGQIETYRQGSISDASCGLMIKPLLKLEQEVKERSFSSFQRLGADKCEQIRHFEPKQEFHLCLTTT